MEETGQMNEGGSNDFFVFPKWVNPEHPDSLGALSAVAQATILELYDPDRSTKLIYRGDADEQKKSWQEAASALTDAFGAGKTGLAVLAEASSSPALGDVRRHFLESRPGLRRWQLHG